MNCILASFLLWSLRFETVDSFGFSSAVPTSRRNPAPLAALEVDATSEVLNGHRSLFLKEDGAIAVPRGVAPGCLTRSGPIIVQAIPLQEWPSILDTTLPHRQSDLVWVMNLEQQQQQPLSPWQRTATVVLLADLDPALSSSSSSPSYVYGKHTAALKRSLTNVVEVKSWSDLCQLVEQATDSHADNVHSDNLLEDTNNVLSVPIPAIDLVCTGERRAAPMDTTIRSVIVVGGGIVGSSIARALSSHRGLHNVTVYDPTSVGTTTPASWAWLNANQKPPPAYKSLNQLGLRAWRSDPLLSTKLSSLKWCGTLVQTKTKLDDLTMGGYTAEGPLSPERIRELEPQANFSANDDKNDGPYVYYFADEGHVNPQEAVLALRQEAMENGVLFVSDERVVGLVRDNNGRVIGVKRVGENNGRETKQLADVVIVSAGANSSDQALGGVPLVHNPSRTYFASPSSSSTPCLNRTLVDMVSSLYIAQRNDGTFVAGGGALKFGLSVTSPSDELTPEEVEQQMTTAQELAQRLAPNPIGNSTFTHKKEVLSKPMPKDGFPILGYLEPGLYSAVTHSGMTLSPLISQLVAAEVKEQVSLSILDDYRPSRFDKETGLFTDWQESKST